MNATLAFLESVLPPEGDHWYVAAVFRDSRVTHRWFRSRLELAAAILEEDRSGEVSVYHACSVFRERAGGRKAQNCKGIGTLLSDIDAGPGKQYATTDAARNAILDFADAEGLPPPLCICSGYGCHAYWPVQTLLDPETWKIYASGLAALLRKHGIKHDCTTNLAALLRPVGTFNRKRAIPAAVTIMDQPRQIPYQLEQLERLLDAGRGTVPNRPVQINGYSVVARLANLHSSGPRYSRRVIEGCGQFGSGALDTRGYVPEPLWHLCLGVFAFIEGDGDQVAHEWSSDDDRYNEQQTQSRLDRIRAVTSGATTCQRFHQENPQTCEACPHWQKINSPIALCTQKNQEPVLEVKSTASIVLPPLPNDFSWNDDNSLCVKHENKNGDPVEIVISKHPIYLDCVYEAEGKKKFSYGFRQLIPNRGWHNIIVNANTLRSSGGLGELSEQGANISDYSVFLKYVTEAVNMHYSSTKQIGNLYEQFGWKDADTSFLFGCSLYLPTTVARGGASVVCGKDIQARTGGEQNWVGPCRGGSLTEWTSIANKLFAAGTEAQSVCLCASFGSVLHRFLSRDEGGAVVSLVTHAGGKGKTTALAGAMSIWGRREGLTIQNIDSSISRGATLASIGNLPLFYDEFETCDPNFVREFIRMFTNGHDKRRMGRDGTMRDAGLSWQTCLFTASNASLVDSIASFGNDVLSSRIWEMSTDVPEHLKGLYAGDQLKDSLRNHSGHAGDYFLSKLVQPGNVAAARHELERWYLQVEKSGKFTNDHRFWVRLAATVAVAAEIVTSGDKILSFDARRITKWLVDQMVARIADKDTETWAFDALGQFINDCQPNQIVVEAPFFPGQVGANVYVKPMRELYIRKERIGGKIYIRRSALIQWCVKHGINTREFTQYLFESGACLNQNKNITLGAGTDYASTQVRCFVIDGCHEKLGGIWGESGDVVPFRRKHDPNNDDSLGGVSDDAPF